MKKLWFKTLQEIQTQYDLEDKWTAQEFYLQGDFIDNLEIDDFEKKQNIQEYL